MVFNGIRSLVYGAEAWADRFLARFVAYYESCVQDIENATLVIRDFRLLFL